MKTTLLTALGAVTLCGAAFAQGSDACGAAQAINGAGTFNYDNSAASTDGAPNPLCYKFGTSQIDNDVWFVWTAATTGTATVSMCGGAGNDTKIAIYSGPGCASAMVDCNDDTCGLQSEVTNGSVVAGNSYLIRIGSFPGGTTGSGTFDITNSGGGCVGGGNDCCSNAQVIAGCGSFPFDNTAAGQDGLGDPMCYKFGTDQIDADVWFSWVAPNTGAFTATMCGGAGNDTKMAVYADTGICPPSPALDCNDDTCGFQSEITWDGTAGASYLIRIGSFPGGSTGAGTFDITGCSA
ncbi:MAG: hypothetical protein E2O39_03960, partial [Planctomycetota bacterium]